MIYVDEPLWPAHGTRFAHLVTDGPLSELHAFAEDLGLSRRAFDGDHYDLPQRVHEAALAAGARRVDRRTMVGIVRGRRGRYGDGPARPTQTGASAVARTTPDVEGLRHRWRDLRDRTGVGPVPAAWDDLGEDLLRRWREPHRYYHDVTHLGAVLARLDLLAGGASDPDRRGVRPGGTVPVEVELAAWFHDAVHDGTPEDERASADLARAALAPLGVEAEKVARLVLATDPTAAPDPADGADLLVDADLGVLAGDPQEYARYVHEVRREYPRVRDDDFARGRAAVLRALLSRPRLFRTPMASARWETRARRNVAAELARLEGRTA